MMTELSLNVLDVAQNSVKAKAKLIEIRVDISVRDNSLIIAIDDDGCGMTPEQLEKVTDPFFTTRSTRDIGLGVPFFKQAAEITGGSFEITSKLGEGTKVRAVFVLDSVDRVPLGDMTGTMETLILYNTDIDFTYGYNADGTGFTLSTRELKETLGGIPLDTPEIAEYIRDYLKENTSECNNNLKGIDI